MDARPPSPAPASRPVAAPLSQQQQQHQQLQNSQRQQQTQPPQPSRVMPTSHLTGPPPGAAASTHVGNYTLYSTIGVGAFGRVKIGVHHHTNARVAIKIMDKDAIREQESTIQVRREIYVMRSLSHKHIVKLFEVLTSETRLYIVMELVVGGELFELIRKNGPLPEHRSRRFFQQLVDGVDFCHKRGVAHRDLKPENLLVDENGDLKITDFGFSSMKGFDANQGLMYTQCGTPDYCAPEIIECPKEGYNGAKVDAWSCGVVLYALLTGRLPFLARDPNDLYDLIIECRPDYSPIESPEARDLLSNLFVRDSSKRYDLAKVKRHPWFLVDYDGDDTRNVKKAPFYNKNPSSLLSSSNPTATARAPSPTVTTGPPTSAAPIAPVFSSAPDARTAAQLANPIPSYATLPATSNSLPQASAAASISSYTHDNTVPNTSAPVAPMMAAVTDAAMHAGYVHPHAHNLAQMHPEEPLQGEPAIDPWPVPHQSYHGEPALANSQGVSHALPPHPRVPESTPQYEWYQPPIPAPDVDIHMSSPPPPHLEVISRVQDRPATPAKRPMSTTAAAAFKAAAAAAAVGPGDHLPAASGHIPVPGSPGIHPAQARMSAVRHNGMPSLPPIPSYEPAGGSRVQSPMDTMPLGADQDGGTASDQDSTEDYEEKPALQLELPPSSKVMRASPRSDFNSLRAQYLQQSTHGAAGRRYDSDLGVNSGASTMMSPVEGPSSMSSMHTQRRALGRDGMKSDPRGLRVPLSSEVPNSPPVVYSPGVNGGTSYDRYRSISPGMSGRHGFGSDVSSPSGSHPSVISGYATPWQASANPYAARDEYGPTNPGFQSEIIARYLWNMICKLRGTDKPAGFRLSQELRSDFSRMVTEINQMQKKEDVAAVFTNFLSLFETHGLSDGRISPVTGRHNNRSRVTSDEEYEDGATVGSREEIPSIGETRLGGPRRVMTDMSSEEEPRSWSPVVTEAPRHQSDLTRRRNISDLLNRMIKKTNKAIPSDRPDRVASVTGDDVEPASKTDLLELNRLMQEHHGGREDSHIAEEFLRLMNNNNGSEDSNSMQFGSTASMPPAQILAQTGRPMDAYSQIRYQGNIPNPSAAVRPSTPHRSHSGSVPLPSEYIPGRLKESQNMSTRADSRVHRRSGRKESNSHLEVGDTTTATRPDMAASMGMHDVPYYGTDKKKVATKLRSALLTMKVRNQMLGERHAQIRTSIPPVSAMGVLGLVLQEMGADVRIKRETKRKMKFVMPLGRGNGLHGIVQFQVAEDDITVLVFGRSKQDRGRTDTASFHTFFEQARERFVDRAHSWVPDNESRNSRRPRPRAGTPLGRHMGDSVIQHA